MRTVFYKSLDRPVNVFGLKGQWVNVFLYMLGGSLVLAFIVGGFTSVGGGFATFLVGGVAAFFACLVLQQKLPARQIDKAKIQSKMRQAVIRRETLSRIVLEDPRKPGCE